ncbi:patatin-like phospholipase family protein [Lentzea aerocolonigenes]|uniref:patatin-like phospholipase family protein n=1 Tax=Lentzea aerocolonigenes TaxID=68170 RepID=UPI000697F49B|nr:patatin-like phospholipase family protein [Lentzea aerocolonigenes]
MNQDTSRNDGTSRRAVVLGGGGPVGASWAATLVHGLVSAGVPLPEADVVLGTSAGAVVGSWLTMHPEGLSTIPERMRERAAWHARSKGADMALPQRMAVANDPRAIGQSALAAMPPISAEQAEALWNAALPQGRWPGRLGVFAVDTSTGTAREWSARDGIPLPVAVACSTAAPGIAPPVTVGDSVWVDGGVRSGTNADLLVGNGPGRVLIVAPIPSPSIAREEAILTERGHSVRVVISDSFITKPADLIDASFIDAAIAAGAKQAEDLAADLGEWWRG